VLCKVTEGEKRKSALRVVNAWVVEQRSGVPVLPHEEIDQVLKGSLDLQRLYHQLPRPNTIGVCFSNLAEMHPFDLVDLFSELVRSEVVSEDIVDALLCKLKTEQQENLERLKQLALESCQKEWVKLVLLESYIHQSMLEENSAPKFKDSKVSFFLSGEQGHFVPDLYCYSEIGGRRLRFGDDCKEIMGYTRTPQYFSISGEDSAAEFCFRCNYASRFPDAALISSPEEWEDYYTASVRCSKEHLMSLDQCFIRGYAAVALHSGIALYDARSILHYLQLEHKRLKTQCQPLTISIHDARSWREGPRLYIEWRMEHKLSEKHGHEIHVCRIPHDITEIRSIVQKCPHFDPLDLMNIKLSSRACNMCDDSSNSWMCIACHRVFCGRYVNAHRTEHTEKTCHYVFLGLNEQYVWCSKCNKRV